MEKPLQFEALKELVRQGLMVRSHSGRVLAGEAFVAVPGAKVDGARFIADALERGAAWVVCRDAEMVPETHRDKAVVHPEPAVALGELAAAHFGTEDLGIPIVGVTGTNGKTTTCYMLEHLFSALGRRVGVLGTVTYRWPGFELDAPLTTPDCWQLHELISNMAAAGVDMVVMEVSSHALAQDRVAGLEFAAGVLTNVTQDHLDYHKTMEDYFQAKARLFTRCAPEGKPGVVNLDDPYGARLAREYPQAVGYGLGAGACAAVENSLCGEVLESTTAGLKLRMRWHDETWELKSTQVGEHNGSNLLAVQAVGLALGVKPAQFKVLESFKGVPGRLERVANSKGLDVFVDYAHTPDALEHVLDALHGAGFARIVTVFGCGGDRDRTKRPLMGRAVCARSAVAVVTSDNPRSEDPLAIIEDIKPGLAACAKVIVEPDRRAAIRLAVGAMRPGDCLLVAGKGHEAYQEIRGERTHFSDQETVREILK
ncbi:MAG: UDP-N-acetylmuramoyl-L-alanyl-D-glutamate--2,6-diaminopimelate ligase [Desulfovibrionaceae bacterium]|jgi:UDP-N-acetylmuramoyl-L-alanyl-D-glutamate--2,6-diaminopimelate ligase|nr:UDP-N-acetylmuramoyl-L-alanyl-D-glutamate--2,6-diaminopimelate ligase [Desulfovibrionaceae bacterium]